MVRLRPFTVDDVEAMVAGHDGAGSLGPTGGDLRARLREQIERNSSLDDGGFLSLAVEADGRLVGDVQARAPKNAFPSGVCEIGITLFAEARGRGVGAETVKLFTELLFREGMERVQASTALDNVAMRHVLEQNGYGFEGVLRGFAPADGGGREDYALYAATRADWPG